MARKPKNWDEMSEGAREAWRVTCRYKQRKWQEANREKKAEYNRKWREANPEKVAECERKWHKNNREKIAEYDRKYYEANREKSLERKRKYQQANREKIVEQKRKHRIKTRTQADADRFFQLMNAANEITKAISEINQSNEI